MLSWFVDRGGRLSEVGGPVGRSVLVWLTRRRTRCIAVVLDRKGRLRQAVPWSCGLTSTVCCGC